jgi:hypothetical protein
MDPQQSTIDITAIITPVAALSLDASGRFIIPAPASFEGLPLITPEQAGRLALANVATFGSQLSRSWDQQRGEPINIDNLRLGDQIYFASTPFHLIPDGYYPSHRREFGPYFLVPLVNGNTIVMIVAVSAFNRPGKGSYSNGQLAYVRGSSAGAGGQLIGIARSSVWITRLPRSRGRARIAALERCRRAVAERRMPPVQVDHPSMKSKIFTRA